MNTEFVEASIDKMMSDLTQQVMNLFKNKLQIDISPSIEGNTETVFNDITVEDLPSFFSSIMNDSYFGSMSRFVNPFTVVISLNKIYTDSLTMFPVVYVSTKVNKPKVTIRLVLKRVSYNDGNEALDNVIDSVFDI